MRMRLCYLAPGGHPVDTGPVNEDISGWKNWVTGMVDSNPDIIFYYTTETTDIFEEEKPACICLEVGSHACGGPWCAPECPVCSPEENEQ